MTSGLHHVTLITRKIQANVDFYVGFLGLRLVKRTAGFEDATQLHLFYGNGSADPGTLVTFLAWEDGSPGRVGHGAPSEIAFAVTPQAIGFWLTRAILFGIAAKGPVQEFGEPVLRLTDPDGVIVKLVGVRDEPSSAPWGGGGIAESDAIRRLRGVTVLSEKPQDTAAFLQTHMGFSPASEWNGQTRLVSKAQDVIDVRNAGGFWTAAPGTGTIDHIAVRAPDRGHVEAVAASLKAGEYGATAVHDRKYFYSLYVREPGGSLIELATDGPGFAIDEAPEALGSTLFIPPHAMKDEAGIKVMLPQFSLPGEERVVYRDLPFVHRIHVPAEPDGSTLVLLHGTGGHEASLFPFGRIIAPNAVLIGLRGRSNEEGVARFFRRFGPHSFDQKDLASEAEAFAAFMEGAEAAYGIDPMRTIHLGYSNGANMLGAVMLLQPGILRKAVLLRPMKVVDEVPEGRDAGSASVLMLTGKDDPYAPYAAGLEEQLRSAGAAVFHQTIEAGHELGPADEDAVLHWLAHPA